MRKWAELSADEQEAIRHAVAQARIVHAEIYWPDIAAPYAVDFRSVYRHFHPLRKPRKPERIGPVLDTPDDTRSLTARILGDPMPGRSALDAERGTYG